jgi:phosphoribosylformylglycinamidine synthase
MILFFKGLLKNIIAVETHESLSDIDIKKLSWLFEDAEHLSENNLDGFFAGPRKEMISPWSTNAVEITQNMGISGICRMEEFFPVKGKNAKHDPMLQRIYEGLSQELFKIDLQPEAIIEIHDIAEYNAKEGLALSVEEVQYLRELSVRIGRKLTDSEVFGFSQVNSEHCRHKIFNGIFIIDGKEMPSTLFQLIKKTTKTNPNHIVSAYTDNCSFSQGPVVEQFAPASQNKPDFFEIKDIETVISLKAETHNFPTTVEPFNGAATGSGGEIRDRIAGGKGALPLAGTAVYMTSYPRTEEGREWEKHSAPRQWMYQSPEEILVKASNGASDFGNKFGQPLICGSLLTYEHTEKLKKYGFDKVIMLAGGIGFGKKIDSKKDSPEKGDVVVLLGGDNYRIGMGGGAVSSVNTGEYGNSIELNAVQRANPEMQKRVYNAIRAMSESVTNPVVSIHDHGAGGHLNCLSELVEATGGVIDISKLPVGDPTLSARELIGNESQERMGLVLKKTDIDTLREISERERAPFYVIGEITDDQNLLFINKLSGEKPINLALGDFFGNPPRTILSDITEKTDFKDIEYDKLKFEYYLEQVLQLESVACKDWLTNKVDRSVTGKVAKQQCAGELQLPLNNLGAMALDYRGKSGVATSIGHAPAAALIDPAAGSVLAIAETLTNIIWAPLSDKIRSVSLSANWMWPAKNPGEDARLFQAVKAASDFAIALGINIPTGKDSLSMTQKYKNDVVYSPGTVIISAAAEISDIRKIVEPVLVPDPATSLIFIDFSSDSRKLGGSSLSQIIGTPGISAPDIKNPEAFVTAFNVIQELISDKKILAGHDISSGGLITALLEMCFANRSGGLNIDLNYTDSNDPVLLMFSENPGIIIQVREDDGTEEILHKNGLKYYIIGRPDPGRSINITMKDHCYSLDIDYYREKWYRSSWLLDRLQSGESNALARKNNYKDQPVVFKMNGFQGNFKSLGINPERRTKSGIRAAIIREKGVNGDREMAYALYLAGFDVKDVHMTDLISGRETLEDINLIVFVGGFSNSDVLGSAKGWAGAFKYNKKAKESLDNFYKRNDTLSLGVCNGCQLMVELGLVYPGVKKQYRMLHNDSHKFESAFLNVEITENNSIMLKSLSGYRLGIWIAHGEGKFILPEGEAAYNIPVKYAYSSYPGLPSGSDFDTAAICSDDGRHLAIMPHLERAFFPWQCGTYPIERKNDDVTPWMAAFVNAKQWIENR